MTKDKGAEPSRAERLPAGRHGLPPEAVKQNQRQRLLAGFAEAVAKHGYQGTTIAHISGAAAVSRNTFYEQFESKEGCFLAAYGEVAEHMKETICAAVESDADWPDRVAASIAVIISYFAAAPDLARLCMVESVAAGPPVASRYQETIDFYAKKLREIQPRQAKEGDPSDATEEILVSGAASLVTRRLNEGRDNQLPALLPDLVKIVLAPYVGETEAVRLASQTAS